MIGLRSEAIAYMSLAFTLFSGVLNIIYCNKKLAIRFYFRDFDFKLLKSMFKFTGWVFIGIVVDQLNWSVDKFLLAWMHGANEVATYNVASQLNIYYMSMATTFSGILTPRVHQMVANRVPNKQISDLFIRVGRFQFIILTMILLGFVAVGYPFVLLWAGEANANAFVIALLLFIPTILPSIQNLGIEIQRAKNMHKFRSLVYVLVAILNIIISIPLCALFGSVGVAIGTAIPVFIGNGLIMNWYYNKYIGLDIPRFWRRITALLPSLVVPAIAAILIACLAHVSGYFGILLWGGIYVVIFIISVWILGLTPREKELVSTPLKHMIYKIVSKLLRF